MIGRVPVSIFCVLSGLGLGSIEAAAQGIPGRVSELERQVSELQAAVADLAGRTDPLTRTVDCTRGETIGAALLSAASHTGPLTLTVRGLCPERVILQRDDVTLRGASAGDGLQAPPSGSGAVLILDGARNVLLATLVVDGNGSSRGLEARRSSSFVARDLSVRRATFGAIVETGSHASLVRAAIEDSTTNGLEVDGTAVVQDSRILRTGGTALRVDAGQIEARRLEIDEGTFGVILSAGSGGTLDEVTVAHGHGTGVWVYLGSAARLIRTRISGSGIGLHVDGSSAVEMSGSVEDSERGVLLTGGSTAAFFGDPGEPTSVRNNAGNGIFVDDTSLARSNGPNVLVTGNGGFGVRCAPAPAVALVTGGFSAASVSGNSLGQIDCPGLSVP